MWLLLAGLLGATAHAQEDAERARAVFAAGCFWCVESAFEGHDGVLEVVSGYTAGHVANPTYLQVGSGRTGHTEAIRVEYDPRRVSFDDLLYVFWRNVDPFDGEGQFCDRGSQYRPGIYWTTPAQRQAAESSAETVRKRFKKSVAVEIKEAGTFYDAESYHQDYAARNPVRYSYYRWSCGRDKRLKELWGDEAKSHGPPPGVR